MQKSRKTTETLAHGYSTENTQRDLSNEYQYDKVWMILKNLCILMIWMKVASALEGLREEDRVEIERLIKRNSKSIKCNLTPLLFVCDDLKRLRISFISVSLINSRNQYMKKDQNPKININKVTWEICFILQIF